MNLRSDLTPMLYWSSQQSKIPCDFVQAFREYYPSGEEVITLECVWEKDKFVLLERANNSNIEEQTEDQRALPSEPSIKYETIQFFAEGNLPFFVFITLPFKCS